MPAQDDVLDRLWVEVINIDPDGRWMRDCLPDAKDGSHLMGAGAALRRLADNKVPVADLGRLGRFVRYETCFGTLEALEDPGPRTGKLKGLSKKLQSSEPKQPKTWKPEEKLLGALWEMIDCEDDGKWLGSLKTQSGEGPFDDTGPTVASLLKQGAELKDLAQVGVCHRYMACWRTLHILEEAGFSDAEAVEGFAELLLSADPSGNEGRPGSWPVKPSRRRKGEGPLWQTRGGQAIAFSPDGRLLAIGAASGPVRLYDVRTGKEQVVCEGLKSHIYQVAFSPDGRRVAIADIAQRLQVCDVRTGKVIWKQRFKDHEVSGLEYSSKTGELVRSCWCKLIDIFDPDTGEKKEPLRPAASTRSVYAITFLGNGDRLAALWAGRNHAHDHVTIWSWPGREPLVRFIHPAEFVYAIAGSRDGKLIALPNTEQGVTLYDAATGQARNSFGNDKMRSMCFTGDLLITGSTSTPQLLFWDVNTGQERFRIAAGSSVDVMDIAVCPDGRHVAAFISRGIAVWQIPLDHTP